MATPPDSKSICVIFNPHAGRRRAKRRLSRFIRSWQDRAEFWSTEYAGHGVELARKASESGFQVVAAAGGDGTAHDVANGLIAANRPETVFAVVPIGSANDYAFSLRKQFGISRIDDHSETLVDVGCVQIGTGTQRFFIESLGLGLSGRVTLESRNIRRLQGPLLYGLAALRALKQDPISELVVQLDDQPAEHLTTLLLTILVGRREGSFTLAPDASLDDGQFDFVHAGRLSRWETIRMLPRLYFFGPPRSHPQIRKGQCRVVRVKSDKPLTMHTDGELLTTPQDSIHEIEIRILPGRLRAKVCSLRDD